MRVTFGKFIHTVVPLIKSAIMASSSQITSSLQEVPSPLEELKTYVRRCFRELKPQLDIAKSFDDVMQIVEEKCTLINVACLEAIINHYNIDDAKVHITVYKSAVDKFCEEVKLSVCENENLSFMTGPSSLLKRETIEFVLGWNTDEHTLSEIQDLLWKAFGDVAKKVLVKELRKGNSIIVTCYAPQNLIDILFVKAKKNLDLLKKMGLMRLTIAFHTIWDEHNRDKVRDE